MQKEAERAKDPRKGAKSRIIFIANHASRVPAMLLKENVASQNAFRKVCTYDELETTRREAIIAWRSRAAADELDLVRKSDLTGLQFAFDENQSHLNIIPCHNTPRRGHNCKRQHDPRGKDKGCVCHASLCTTPDQSA